MIHSASWGVVFHYPGYLQLNTIHKYILWLEKSCNVKVGSKIEPLCSEGHKAEKDYGGTQMAEMCGNMTQRNILHNASPHSNRHEHREETSCQTVGIPGDAMSQQEIRGEKEIMSFALSRTEHECRCEVWHKGVRTEAQL